jgi:transcriptional regulator with XRE-family HTH domain
MLLQTWTITRRYDMAPAAKKPRTPRERAVFPGQLLAANVRSARALLNLSQHDLAERMSALSHQWSRPTVGQVEHAARPVSVDELFGLAHALEVDILLLLSAPEGSRVGIDTGLPRTLYPAAIKGMLTHDSPHRPYLAWQDNKPVRVQFPATMPTPEDFGLTRDPETGDYV